MVQFELNISKSKPNITESESFITIFSFFITETNAKTLVVYVSPMATELPCPGTLPWRRSDGRYSTPRHIILCLVNNAIFYSPACRRARQC